MISAPLAQSDKRSYSSHYGTRCVLWLIIIIFSLCQFFMALPTDAQALLSFSLKFLEDGSFCENVFDMNLPFIFLIHTISAFFIKNFDLSPRFIFHIYNLFLCFMSYFIFRSSLKKRNLSPQEQNIFLDIYAFVIIVGPSLAFNWGQRDHLIFVFTLPWIIQVLWNIKPTVATIFLSAVGLSIRPHNVVIPFIIIIFKIFEFKNIKNIISNSKIINLLNFYFFILFSVLVFFKKYTNIIYVSILSYPYLTHDFKFKIIIIFLYMIILCIMFCITKKNNNLFQIKTLTFLFIVLFLLNQPWHYNIIYLIMPLFFMVLFFFYEEKFFLKKILLLPIIFYFFFGIANQIFIDLRLSKKPNFIIEKNFLGNTSENGMIFQQIPENAGDHFVLLSTNFWGSRFVALGKTHHDYAFDWLWPLPWVYTHQDDQRAEKIRKIMADYLVKALEQTPAPTLFIDRSPYMYKIPHIGKDSPALRLDDFLAYNHERLKSALQKYTWVKTLNEDIYKIDVYKLKSS